MRSRPSILFRCDGAPDIGLGHIVRCLALADELKKQSFNIYFAMRKGPLGIKMVEEKGYEVIVSQEESGDFAYGERLKQCVGQTNAQAIIFDVRDGLSKDVVKKIREDGVLIVDTTQFFWGGSGNDTLAVNISVPESTLSHRSTPTPPEGFVLPGPAKAPARKGKGL